jgi:mannose-6-phosphate isomerase-like protein (cupin superfamily)
MADHPNSFDGNIEELTLENENFRKVLYTTKSLQLVVMALKINEEIGMEIHKTNDQFIRIEQGMGLAIINNIKIILKNGSVVIIPAGTPHNIINTGNNKLKLYTLYSPPHHKDQLIQENKPNEFKKNQYLATKNIYINLKNMQSARNLIF